MRKRRASKVIGSSLEAALLIKLNEDNKKIIREIDLAELCITSSVKIEGSNSDEIIVKTTKAEGKKCPVCWKISTSPCERHPEK